MISQHRLRKWLYAGGQQAIIIWTSTPDSKVHVAHMGPTWVLSTPGWPHVGPMNFVIRGVSQDLHCYMASQGQDELELEWIVDGLATVASPCIENLFIQLGFYHHDDVIKRKHFPRNWPFVRGIHRSRWIPHAKASDAELWCLLDLRLNKRSSKPWGWWFETPSWSL